MSKTLIIEVIDVATPSFVKTAKGGYNIVEIAYKEGGKVGGKKIVDFANPDVYKAVLELKPKDQATVVIEKEAGSDGKEYWQWKSVAPGADTSGQSTGTSTAVRDSAVSTKPAGRVTGSNYETADERATRQLLIVRQSSITAALKYHEQAGADVTVSDVIALAETFKDYVFNGIEKVEAKAATAKAKTKAVAAKDAVADMDDDIPF